MCSHTERLTPDRIDGFSDLKRHDSRLGAMLSAALLAGIVIASTTFYLRGLEASASILLY